MSQKKYSVITAVYNVEKYLDKFFRKISISPFYPWHLCSTLCQTKRIVKGTTTAIRAMHRITIANDR